MNPRKAIRRISLKLTDIRAIPAEFPPDLAWLGYSLSDFFPSRRGVVPLRRLGSHGKLGGLVDRLYCLPLVQKTQSFATFGLPHFSASALCPSRRGPLPAAGVSREACAWPGPRPASSADHEYLINIARSPVNYESLLSSSIQNVRTADHRKFK